MTPLAALGDGTNPLALVVFAVVLASTLGITYWASKRTRSASEFFAAGRGITGFQNGVAIAGDYLSASTFLGFAGLIFLLGLDGWFGVAAATLSFLPLVLFLAERLRNAGKYTMADVLAFRLDEKPARVAAALGTLGVTLVYLVAQMVGAGVLLQALAGVPFSVSVLVTGAFMIVYVVFGGMVATTWVQIIKAGLLMTAGAVLTVLVLAKANFNPFELFSMAEAKFADGAAYGTTGQQYVRPIDGISFGLALLLGTAGLPHILVRFFTVPDSTAARKSIGWAVGLIGTFFVFTMIVGVGARAILGDLPADSIAGGNLVTPLLAEELGGGAGTVGGDLFVAIISAVAFATILAVVAGLMIAASGAVGHDVYGAVIRRGEASEQDEVRVARVTAVSLGIVAMLISLGAGEGFNVALLIGLAFAIAASANLPALLCALFWRRFNTTGAVVGVVGGLLTAVVLIVMSPDVWPGESSPVSLANPAIISVPAGFAFCWLGTLIGARRSTAPDAEARYHELRVRAETGIGAET